MGQFFMPFFNNTIKVEYTPNGVTEIHFEKGKKSHHKPSDLMAKKIEKQLSSYLSGQNSKIDIPIDWQNLKGSEFQKKVWKKMYKIPFGKVKSYGEIAKTINSPGAARAVGTACAKNPVLLAIPCHRVVGANGLGGFSGGGLGVKRQLLELENISY